MSLADFDRVRIEEPEVFHGMVKMHLSFLLDLNTDDCDCSFVFQDTLLGPPCAKESSSSSSAASSLRKRIFTPKKMLSATHGNRGVMDGAKLTHEGVCQVFQLIQYLGRPHNIQVEGIFRKHGNLKKQHALKERLNRGVTIDLDDGEFSVHECAAVLKSFLAELTEPLLTEAYYRAHCQVAQLVKASMTESDQQAAAEKKIKCLQLLFLLIPEVNYSLLKDLLFLLVAVSKEEESNKMSVTNLGTLFAPLILCPRKLSAESLQSNHQMLTKAVAFMIKEADKLFCIPSQLCTDLEMYLKNRENQATTTPASATISRRKHYSLQRDQRPQSPVVNTVFSFVDRQKSNQLAAQSSTDTALAELYAQVQAMPESAQKKKLISRLNEHNGQGTPGFYRSVPKRFRKKSGGEGLKGLLTPKRKPHASYNLQVHTATPAKPPSQILNSFIKKQNYETVDSNINQKLLSPQTPPAILVSPSTIDTLMMKSSSKGEEEEEEKEDQDLDGSYVAPPPPFPPRPLSTFKKLPPPVPERMSSLNNDVSPITNCAKKMTTEMRESMMTPRSRKPVLAMKSVAKLDGEFCVPMKPPMIVEESPCQPPKYNEDEPDWNLVTNDKDQDDEPETTDNEEEEEEDDDDEEEEETANYFNSLSDEEGETEKDEFDGAISHTPGVSTERDVSEIVMKTKAYSCQSLKRGFQHYLEVNDIVPPSELSSSSSVLDASVSSSVIDKEAQMLLNGDMSLSESMRAVLDGDDPDQEEPNSVVVMPSVLEPVDVDSRLSLIEEEEDKENNSFVSAKSDLSTYSSTSTLPCHDIPLPIFGNERQTAKSTIQVSNDNDDNPQPSSAASRRIRRRRSLTEVSGKLPLKRNDIIFETDL